MSSFFSELKLVFSIASRFSRVDRKSRSAVTSKLATCGLCFGVMTLVVVMCVMNGFQMSFIKSIQEISSYHVQVSGINSQNEAAFSDFCKTEKDIRIAVPFMQAQTLMTHNLEKNRSSDDMQLFEHYEIVRTYESSAYIRAVPPDCFYDDKGFGDEVKLIAGFFNLSESGNIVVGSELASTLKVTPGDKVNLFVLSGGSDVDLFSEERIFTVTGIFTSGYQEINSSFCFISSEDGKKYFGKDSKTVYGLKLKNINDDSRLIHKIQKNFNSELSAKSWKEYNKSFFGTLRIEKNMMLLLICLIFVVVAINIYNGMCRLVCERQREIAILTALGARIKSIQFIFVMRGLLTGFIGSFLGVLFGIIISKNIDIVFNAVSSLMYFFQYIFTAVFDNSNLAYVHENSAYSLYATIPAKIYYSEILMIFLFGLLAPVFACFAASRNILKMSVTEVLHNE